MYFENSEFMIKPLTRTLKSSMHFTSSNVTTDSESLSPSRTSKPTSPLSLSEWSDIGQDFVLKAIALSSEMGSKVSLSSLSHAVVSPA